MKGISLLEERQPASIAAGMAMSRDTDGGRSEHGKLSVLVVEDEPTAREACCRFLEHRGVDVFSAADAAEALRKAEALTPQLVVCDWFLGGSRDGVSLAREIQDRYGSAVVFMTGHPLDELEQATRGMRVLASLSKPLSLPELARTVEQVRLDS